MPPDGMYVSAFSVSSDRVTSSAISPASVLRPIHSVQKLSVGSSEPSASVGSGAGRCDSCQVSTNHARSPAPTVKSAYVAKSRPYWCTSLRRAAASGPATATIWSSTRRTHGVTLP